MTDITGRPVSSGILDEAQVIPDLGVRVSGMFSGNLGLKPGTRHLSITDKMKKKALLHSNRHL